MIGFLTVATVAAVACYLWLGPRIVLIAWRLRRRLDRRIALALALAVALAPLLILIDLAERLRAWVVYELLHIPRAGRDYPWRPD